MPSLIVTSTQDVAGASIKEELLRIYPFTSSTGNPEGHKVYSYDDILLTSTERPIVEASHVEEWFDVDLIVFASKHRSASATPCLTVHTPGNLSHKAEVGGLPRRICISAPLHMKAAISHLQEMAENLGLTEKYEVVMECTHHGDYLERTPCFFIEIGSSEGEWRDHLAAEAVAKSIIPSTKKAEKCKAAIGLGGPHYHHRLTELALISDIAIGHIAPKYALRDLDGEMIRQMVERTHPRPEIALLDWKGLGKERKKIISTLEKAGIKWLRLSHILDEYRR